MGGVMEKQGKLTERHLHVLQHALGADEYGRWPKGHEWYYRNYYIGDDPDCEDMVMAGFMEKFPGNVATGGDTCYRVTGNGILAMRQSSPKPPVRTRSQQRFDRFRDWSDATGGTFKDFLKTEHAR
jgi:hypothetical protein